MARSANSSYRRWLSRLTDAVYVGRTVDHTPAALDVLPSIRKSVGLEILIILVSGIRRGCDIVTAPASSADAVALVRLIALGLAADGEYGVRRTLELLQCEF